MPETQQHPLGRQLAKTSWAAPLTAAVAISMLTQAGLTGGTYSLVMTGVGAVVILIGLVCGLVALARVRRDGRKGVLIPGLIGTLISGFLILLMVDSFRAGYQRRVGPVAELSAALHDLQQRLPLQMDDQTMLNQVTQEGMVVVFDYSVLDPITSEIDLDGFTSGVKGRVVAATCEPLRDFWDAGMVLQARFRGPDRVVFAEVALRAKDCTGSG